MATDNYRAGWTHAMDKESHPTLAFQTHHILAGRTPATSNFKRAEKGWGQMAESYEW